MRTWPTIRLRDVVAVQRRLVDPGATPDAQFSLYSIPAFDHDRLPSTELGSAILSDKLEVEPGWVLFSRLNPRIARVWQVGDRDPCPRIASTEFIPLLPMRDLDAGFLQAVLESPGVRHQILGRTAAATKSRERLDQEALLDVRLPLPPLDEQRRIAARLRDQRAEISLVASAAQARMDELDSLVQRAIDSVIPASDAVALGHALRTPLRTGLSRAASVTANHRVLTLSSVRNGVLDVGQNRPMDATGDEALANAVRPSMFYVVRGNGSLHMAGAGALSPVSTDGVVLFPDLLIQVDPDPALLSVDYLALAWRSHRVRHQVEARLRTSAGIHKINLANLSTVDVPTPAITAQRRITARLRDQLTEIDRAKTALEAQRAAIDALPAALLREVFGEVNAARA